MYSSLHCIICIYHHFSLLSATCQNRPVTYFCNRRFSLTTFPKGGFVGCSSLLVTVLSSYYSYTYTEGFLCIELYSERLLSKAHAFIIFIIIMFVQRCSVKLWPSSLLVPLSLTYARQITLHFVLSFSAWH